MGNTFTFILEYQTYIENIQKFSSKYDRVIYDKLKNKKLVEGLIKTHPLNKSVDIIKRRFDELSLEIEEDGEIYVEGDFKKLEIYLPLFTNLGYFISKLTINGDDWIKDFSDDSKPLAIYLEPKYDTEIYPIPKILYHVTPKKFGKKISKIGFIPKTGNKLSNHPDRIYFTDNIKIAKAFGKNMKIEYNEDYNIYEIDTSGISKLYSDINLRDNGYYTLGNVSPKYLRKFKVIMNIVFFF